MNKLLQTTLIAAVLSTSVMAEESALPNIIEADVNVYINKDIRIIGTTDNYGNITTQCAEGSYPTIMGYSHMPDETALIRNHVGDFAVEETETDAVTTIKTNNAITNVSLEKVYKIVEGGGNVDDRLQLSGVTVEKVNDIDALDFRSLTANDLLYLGTDEEGKTIQITSDNAWQSKEGVGNKFIYFHFGDQGVTQYVYNVEFLNDDCDNIESDFSNYKKGSIKITGKGHTQFTEGSKFYVPMRIEASTSLNGTGINEIYGNVTVSNTGQLFFGPAAKTTLKSGATLTIGEVETNSGS